MEQILTSNLAVYAVPEGSGHSTRCLCRTRSASPDVGRCLLVLATRDHDDLRLCRFLFSLSPAFGHTRGVAIRRNLHFVAEVQGRSAVTAVQDHPHPDTLRHVAEQNAVKLVIGDLTRLLEVARYQCLVLAIRLISFQVLLLASMATVVQEQLITIRRTLAQPLERFHDVGLGGHHVGLVISQLTDHRILEAEGVLEDIFHCVRIVDAA
mmetsp:Transcript_30852/g.57697  ORF Transcript_30852/g.57697 Transcript_30852/m.57697 type:complete len:209 (-) Transcript_30852:2647-3273(-)